MILIDWSEISIDFSEWYDEWMVICPIHGSDDGVELAEDDHGGFFCNYCKARFDTSLLRSK